MPIEIINGDLLKAFDLGEVEVIGHVVNCQGVMGSGIAKSIRERYPNVYKGYKWVCESISNTGDMLGFAQQIYLANELGTYLSGKAAVWNLFAQNHYGSPSRDLNYGALGKCLYDMAYKLDIGTKIGFPYKMGSDRAKGDWNVVLEMIQFYFQEHDVKIYRL